MPHSCSTTRPLQIYLDSSDISRLSAIETQSADVLEVREFLISRQSQGKIQLRFSEAHVTEAAPVTESAIPPAIRRFETIKYFCGTNCLVHPLDVIEHELNCARSNQPSSRAAVFRDDGFWFPKLFYRSDFLPSPESIVADDIGKLNRESRRELIRNGKLTPAAYKRFRDNLPAFGREISQRFPLNDKALQLVRQYYVGNSSRTTAIKAVNDSLADLDEIGRWYLKDWEEATKFSRYLRESGAEFQTGINNGKQEAESLVASLITNGTDRETVNRIFSETFLKKLPQSSIKLAQALSDNPNEPLPKVEDPWISLPGISTAITVAMYIARRSVLVGQRRVPKQSDFGDTYHALYLPYVDIFRADAFVAGIIGECKLPFETVVVDRFLDLPKKIDLALEKRGL